MYDIIPLEITKKLDFLHHNNSIDVTHLGGCYMGMILWIMIMAAGLAALVHVFSFLMESVFWTKPAVMKTFRQNEESVKTTKLLAFNQGFYNLFLAIGTIVGLCLVLNNRLNTGLTIIASTCSIMLGAGIVLLISSPRMLRGALIQGIPPLIFLVLLLGR
jgi:putative membrane protein